VHKSIKIDARGLSFKELNRCIRNAIREEANKIELFNVNGQRYIGDGLKGDVTIIVHGVAGNDLGAFMDGPSILVFSDAGDAIGNTMNSGKIVVHGSAGDVVGYSMRGGKLFIRGNAGYRVGIHLKEYQETTPKIVIGGLVRDFLGEYMAGGRVVVLGLDTGGENVVGNYVASGMHGGKIYIRGGLSQKQLGIGAKIDKMTEEDYAELRSMISEFCQEFGLSIKKVMSEKFSKIVPVTYRPYMKLYALRTL
jgi:glutamate synthase domain-containing protein 3